MRLLTYRYDHVEAVGALTSDGRILPVETLTLLFPGQELLQSRRTMLDIIRGGEPVLAALREAVDRSNEQEVALLDVSEVELLAPIPRPPKIVATGDAPD